MLNCVRNRQNWTRTPQEHAPGRTTCAIGIVHLEYFFARSSPTTIISDMDLSGLDRKNQPRNQEVFDGKREQVDARVSA